jgi:MoxR-like ATPase
MKSVVVLLDEIDKADPDVPNNLLEPFGDFRFSVGELPGVTVQALRKPLLVITTNNERRLPDAFIRRCVDLSITRPSASTLALIGAQHFGSEPSPPSTAMLQLVADAVVKIDSYSTAEYLDTVRAIRTLGIAEESDAITQLIGVTVRKTAKQIPQ